MSVLTSDDELESLQHSGCQETRSTQGSGKWRQHCAALIATLGAMSAGCALGWTSPVLPILQGTATNASSDAAVTDEEASWIGSIIAIGALLGAIPAGCLADLLGRRKFLLLLGFPFVAGWGIVLLAHHSVHQVLLLYIARFVLGLAVGAVTVVVPIYSTEIAEDDIRGALGAYMQFMITFGILWVYVFGALVRYCCLPIACVAVPIIFCLSFICMPESPIYLLTKGRNSDAEKSLLWLRGFRRGKYHDYDIDAEIMRLEKSINESGIPHRGEVTRKPFREIRQFLLSLSFRSATGKAVQIVFGLMAFQQLSGINAVIFYTGNIFDDPESVLKPATATIIVGLMQVLATYTSSLLVDRVGRRVLLLISDGGMAICLLTLSIYFYLQDQNADLSDFGWLPLLALATYIVLFSIGLGPIPWLMMAELVPTEAKCWASAFAACLNWSLVFTVTKLFPSMLSEMGTWATFGLFSVVCTVGSIFVALAVPETRGKNLIQIQQELGKT